MESFEENEECAWLIYFRNKLSIIVTLTKYWILVSFMINIQTIILELLFDILCSELYQTFFFITSFKKISGKVEKESYHLHIFDSLFNSRRKLRKCAFYLFTDPIFFKNVTLSLILVLEILYKWKFKSDTVFSPKLCLLWIQLSFISWKSF